MTEPTKYPKTPHLPFSPEVKDDDVKLDDKHCTQFLNREVIITEKMDGGNCQLFQGRVYARTTSKEATHKSFSAVKQLYSQFSYLVPENLALFGENMMGIHSIEYNALASYFYLFGVLQDGEQWWSWDEVEQYALQTLEIPAVPILYRGTFKSMKEIQNWMEKQMKSKQSTVGGKDGPEGFVIRVADGFSNKDFERNVAKFVRKGHIQTNEDWSRTWKQAKLLR
jgi:hypothetical protein